MKNALLLIASLLMANLVFAQTETTTVSPAEAVVVPTTTVPSTQNTSSDMDDNSNIQGRFRVSLFSLGGVDRTQLTNGSDQIPSMYFFENYLSFAYKISKDFRMAARYSFNYSTAGSDRDNKDVTDKADTRDMSLLLTWYNLLEDSLPLSMTYKFQPRLYLPTSEKSKAQGMISALRLENELKYFTDRYSNFRLAISPEYYFQRSTAYVTENRFGGVSTKTTDMFLLKHSLEYSHNVNKLFSLKVGYEVEDEWSNESEINRKDEYRKTAIDYRLGVEFRPSKKLNFTLGYGHNRDLIQIGQFRDGFTLMTNAALF